MTLRWRKQPDETGLRRMTQGPRGFELRDGKAVILHVAALGRGADTEWFWYGLGQNTAARPNATADAAKAEADAYARAHYKPEGAP